MVPGSRPRASGLGGCVSSLNVSVAAWGLRLCEAHFCPLGFRTGVSTASAQRLPFQGPLGSPCESAAAEGGMGLAHAPAWSPQGGAQGLCRLVFHLGHVPCQMVSRDGVTGSQRSPPTRPHQGPENGGCRAGRDAAGWLGTGLRGGSASGAAGPWGLPASSFTTSLSTPTPSTAPHLDHHL